MLSCFIVFAYVNSKKKLHKKIFQKEKEERGLGAEREMEDGDRREREVGESLRGGSPNAPALTQDS